MKLLTKRLLAVAMVIAMTLGMAMSAMALPHIDDANLEKVGIDPDNAVIIYGWVNIEDAAGADGNSDESGTEYVKANGNGTYTIDFSKHASSIYTNFAVVHNYAGSGQEIVEGTVMTVSSLSPFCLVGEKKDSDGGNGGGKHSGNGGKKSPKTGMNDSWMLWLMAAGVFAGASVVAYNKKKG